jgi:hypothetical protein
MAAAQLYKKTKQINETRHRHICNPATQLKLKKPGSNDYGVDFMAMDVLLKI